MAKQKSREEELFDAYNRGLSAKQEHCDPSPVTIKYMTKVDVQMAEMAKDVKSILEKLESNEKAHEKLSSAQEYTNGKVRNLFIWKATIVGMALVIGFIGKYIISDYIQTKNNIDDIDKRISTVENYFEKTK